MTNPLRKLFPGTVERDGALSWPSDCAERGYVIFFTGRCGSTELVDVLRQTGKCGNPNEYFNEEFVPHYNDGGKCDRISDYMARLVEHHSTGRVFGFKIDGFRHRRLCELVDPMSYFPKTSFKFIYMNRRNLLEQAYSYAHAKKTGIWHLMRDAANGLGQLPSPVEISDEGIWLELALILEQEFYFERYFIENSLTVVRIDYEMLCASKASLIADVMLSIGCGPTETGKCLAGLSENYRKIRYDASKCQRLIDFRHKFGWQLAYLSAYRGRLPFASVRNYLRTNAGVEVAQSGS
jgi:LPS sulfotransferase NodH